MHQPTQGLSQRLISTIHSDSSFHDAPQVIEPERSHPEGSAGLSLKHHQFYSRLHREYQQQAQNWKLASVPYVGDVRRPTQGSAPESNLRGSNDFFSRVAPQVAA